MVSCPLCEKTFQDRRGLHGHFRFKHGIEYGSGEPAKKTVLTEATKKKVEEMQEGRKLTKALKEREFQGHSLDRQIDEAEKVIKEKEFQTRSLDKQINDAKEEIKRLSEEAKEEFKQLSEGVKLLNKGVRDVRDKPSMAVRDSVTPVVTTTRKKESEKTSQPVLKRELRDEPTTGSNRREDKGMFEEIYDDSIGAAFSSIRDVLPKPRRFFRRRRLK